jgi:hypothetical protein
MAKPKQPLSTPEDTLEILVDRVSNARAELVAIERTLERLRSDVTNLEKQKWLLRIKKAREVNPAAEVNPLVVFQLFQQYAQARRSHQTFVS